MTATKTNFQDVDPIANALHFLWNPLDCNQLGITVVKCDHRTDTRDTRTEEEST